MTISSILKNTGLFGDQNVDGAKQDFGVGAVPDADVDRLFNAFPHQNPYHHPVDLGTYYYPPV